MLGKSYLVVANRSEAKVLLEKDGASSLENVTTLVNEDGRASDGDLVTDRPGAVSAAGGTVPGIDTMSRKSAADIEAERFAGTVADWLDKRRSTEKVYHVDIIAAPSFLGRLRGKMSKPLSELVGVTVNKDVVNEDSQLWINYLKAAGRGTTVQ
ncbi:host attachment protein [Alteromonas sp. C1M14]|uniref:host attachment protein n=1 Tax=Alteromonas sp. C1M14 TaxID=2841567 RepID=UPI001C09AC1D|nr:host attachment protein [Alteromonas sp. C1M14]MBU2979313.1 host attachment protein [Alteromonas sp. C1M14]